MSTKSLTNLSQVVAKYPVRNQRWMLADGKMVAEISELTYGSAAAPLDPWGRPITSPLQKVWGGQGEDQEVVGFLANTTVEGVRVVLSIIND